MENLKHVLVCGNGFDLAIGRKTSYWDFYQSGYCPKNYSAPLITYLNKKLGNGKDVRWLDMETAIQQYAIEANKNAKGNESYFTNDEKKVIAFLKTQSVEPVIENYHALATGVSNFDEIEYNLIERGVLYRDKWAITRVPFELSELDYTRIERDRIALKRIEDCLAAYLRNMPYQHEEEMNTADTLMLNALKSEDTRTYSFNYTDISRVYTDDENKAREYDKKISYVHGSLKDNHIIIGAKDGDYGDYNFLQKVFDDQYGAPSLLTDLLEAEEVDIYGHSLGECDSQYFMPFFYQQVQATAKRKRITIYTYDAKSKECIKSNLQKLTGNKLSLLYNLNKFEIVTQK